MPAGTPALVQGRPSAVSNRAVGLSISLKHAGQAAVLSSVTRKSAKSGLEVMTDGEGSIVVGWVVPNALYCRLSGGLSARLGSSFASKLGAMMEGKTSILYFSDASALKHYDLLARSAIVRVLLANRRSFESFTILTWAGGFKSVEQALAAALGGVDLLTDKDEFELRLLRAAPTARQQLDPKTWVRWSSPEPRR